MSLCHVVAYHVSVIGRRQIDLSVYCMVCYEIWLLNFCSYQVLHLPPPTLHSFRRLHSIDIGSFLTDLKSSRLITHPPKSLGSLLIAYNTTHSSLLDKHAPIITKLTRRQSPSNPWFTPALCAFRSTVRHAEDLWKHTHSAVDWSSFKSLRNK